MRSETMVGVVLGMIVAGCSGLQAGALGAGWLDEPEDEPSSDGASWAERPVEAGPRSASSAQGAPRPERPGDGVNRD